MKAEYAEKIVERLNTGIVENVNNGVMVMRRLDRPKEVKTSVIVLTYEPVEEKLFFTLDSVTSQTVDDFEIILSDDGSKDSKLLECIDYLEAKEFHHYSIVFHMENGGTVRNTFDALKAAAGKYIKLISPGDAFVSADMLQKWTEHLEKSGRAWSFGDAIHYKKEEDEFKAIEWYCHPQIVDCYLKHDDEACRWNYVAYDDNVLGSSVLCEKAVMYEYLEKIIGKVIFLEDSVYRIMMFDGVLPEYYQEEVILYEVGDGISTCEDDGWKKKIAVDWKNAEKIMLAGVSDTDPLQKRFVKIYKKKNKEEGNKLRKLLKIFEKGYLRITFVRWFKPRMSKPKFP